MRFPSVDDDSLLMNRRDYLLTLTGMGVASGGCLGSVGTGSSDTHLPPPEDRYTDPEDLPYPGHGQRLPEVTMADPLADAEITTTEFDRITLMTFFYSHCNTVCPLLVSSLRNVQTAASNGGYGDEVVFLPVTFDPVRDTADRLREFGTRMNVDFQAGNWHFLRPASEARAKSVVNETFGVGFSKTGPVDSDEYMYNHLGLILVANGSGYVERAYVSRGTQARDIEPVVDRLRDARS